MKTLYLRLKIKHLIALSQKNKQNRMFCPILLFQNLLEFSSSNTSSYSVAAYQ